MQIGLFFCFRLALICSFGHSLPLLRFFVSLKAVKICRIQYDSAQRNADMGKWVMNKWVVILGAGLSFSLSACTEKKVATPEELWHGYCTSIGNAARTITLDRQNGITREEATAYAEKVTDVTTNTFLMGQIEKVYSFPADQLKVDKDALQAKFKQEATDLCLKTPYDPNKMPDYKAF